MLFRSVSQSRYIQATPERIANQSGKKDNEFVLSLIEEFLKEEYKREVIRKVESSTFEELKELDNVVTVKKEEIATIKAEAEKAEKISLEEIKEETKEEIIAEEIIETK